MNNNKKIIFKKISDLEKNVIYNFFTYKIKYDEKYNKEYALLFFEMNDDIVAVKTASEKIINLVKENLENNKKEIINCEIKTFTLDEKNNIIIPYLAVLEDIGGAKNE